MENLLSSCPAGVYAMDVSITEADTDGTGCVTPGALARMMQAATEAHMKDAGLGYQVLRDKGFLWFIVWTSIWAERMPKAGEDIVICTWPGEVKLGMYSRRYVFYTKAGEELLQASSLFMMIDEETRKMVAPDELPSELAEVVIDGQPALPKQRMKFPELPLAQTHAVEAQEIDKNGHVNNAYYLDWAYSLLNPAYVEKHPLKHFWVQYSKELMSGQTVEMQHGMQENGLFVKGVADGETSFQVKMEFAE